MSGGYERVNAHDVDDPETPVSPVTTHPRPIPNSPPPSFHSRSSSTSSQRHRVNAALEDAFGSDDSDDEADDRQRLVRPTVSPDRNSTAAMASMLRPAAGPRPTTTESTQPQDSQVEATTPGRVYGAGVQSDGVFANLTAKPDTGAVKEEQPPTYEQAAADAAPPYWETTILAPGMGGPDDVYIDGMPVGSVFSFVWNGMISMSFQFVGFLLTYLLHSTHAAKNGSRAGLGITLIQYGFYMKGSTDSGAGGMSDGRSMAGPNDGYATPPDPNAHDFDPNSVNNAGDGSGSSMSDIASSDWVAYVLMVVGWFILIRSVADYLKARRHEQLVLQSPDRGLGIPIIAEGESPAHVV